MAMALTIVQSAEVVIALFAPSALHFQHQQLHQAIEQPCGTCPVADLKAQCKHLILDLNC